VKTKVVLLTAVCLGTIAVICIYLLSSEPARITSSLPLRSDLKADRRITATINETNIPEALEMYAELTGRRWLPATNSSMANMNLVWRDRLARWGWMRSAYQSGTIQYHADGIHTAREIKEDLEALFKRREMVIVAQGEKSFRVVSKSEWEKRL
jgi:hypothetical protein